MEKAWVGFVTGGGDDGGGEDFADAHEGGRPSYAHICSATAGDLSAASAKASGWSGWWSGWGGWRFHRNRTETDHSNGGWGWGQGGWLGGKLVF